jgi:gamma-glutamylputrescine oxidase
MSPVTDGGPHLGTPLWSAALGRRPPLAGEHRADVCVVGLGAAGLTATTYLLERGARVIGVDSGRIGDGASGRNGGLLLSGAASFHHDTARRVGRHRAAAVHRATLDELDGLATAMPDLVRRTGSLRIAADERELADCEDHLGALRADGLEAEPYDGPEGRGLLLPRDASFDPGERIRRLAERALEAGAALYERSRVDHVGGGLLRTPAASVHADAVVVAVDGGLERLLPELAGRVRTARAQMLGTAPTVVDLPRPVYRRWGYDYWQRLPDGRLAVGGGRDIGGEEEWTDRSGTTPEVQRHLERLLSERLGVHDADVTHRWSGAIAFTVDRMPVVEEVRPGVVACGAYSGTGNLIGPMAARAAVDLALDGRSAVADLLRPD